MESSRKVKSRDQTVQKNRVEKKPKQNKTHVAGGREVVISALCHSSGSQEDRKMSEMQCLSNNKMHDAMDVRRPEINKTFALLKNTKNTCHNI